MKTKLMQLSALCLLLAAVLTPLSGCGASYGYDDKIVSTGENQLTIVDQQGLRHETHQVAADAKITRNGQRADLSDLASGDAVNVTVERREGQEVATVINAKSEAPAEADRPSAEPMPSPPAASSEPESQPRPEDVQPSDATTTEVAVDGAISSIDLLSFEFIVKESSGNEQIVTVDEKTTFNLDGEEATWESMKVGYHVKVVAERRGEALLAKAVDGLTR